jgi:DNA helicase HerA-like ATPase
LATAPLPIDAIPVGRRISVGEETVSLPTRLLQRHIAIIAGSGSGKTVLLRRIVEEAALAGIPAIVIDPNNDLSRLGDPWPKRPESFIAEDDAKAQRFFKTVEVVVWTPGIHAGKPLFLSVMPDFASLGDDKDERQQAIDMAAETLAPLIGAKNQLQRGVLVEALRHFANSGGGDLARFTALLADLPEGMSPIGNAERLAAGMADQLHAAIATNPLLRAAGPVLDPKLLFFGRSRRVRVSVINLSGLTSDAAKEDFINRLQMTLFSWIKKHPSVTGLLYVIDEAQTFLPSQKPALSLGSGVKLVAQARKYGLGMIVATQAPRGIHNQVVSNCTTQFFGKQNAPATIGAAQEIIAASGGRADDIGKLKTGEFYFATEGSGRPGKVRTPICLSYHPPNPPAPEEVIARAKR